jgi:hypothetical protein
MKEYADDDKSKVMSYNVSYLIYFLNGLIKTMSQVKYWICKWKKPWYSFLYSRVFNVSQNYWFKSVQAQIYIDGRK